MRPLTTLALLVVCTNSALAGPLLDYIRNYDLNDYAFGVALAARKNPYTGAENGSYAYPYLTSFRDSAMTNDWLLVRDGDVGLRWVSDDGDWELGAVGRLQTLGLGNSDAPELEGITDREWTLEAGPMVGWRGWPVHINVKTYAELSDRHDGMISELTLSVPMEWSRGFLVPSVEYIYQDSDYVDYYYGVSEASATPARPAFNGESASNFAVKARWGYALNRKWLLSGAVGYEMLDSSIEDSPIVDTDALWSARLGLAYNTDVFRPRDYDFSAPDEPRFNFKIGVFRDRVDSEVRRDAANGLPGFEFDLEDAIGVTDDKSVLQVDANIRFGNYHQLEFGYFELGRDSMATTTRDISFGNLFVPAGTELDTNVDVSTFRAGYSYSLIRDSQKELSVMAGVHLADFEVRLTTSGGLETDRSDGDTPLPVVGLNASVFLGEKTTVSAKAQIFRTDFDQFEGSLNYLTVDVRYRFAKSISIGAGYNYYGMELSSSQSSVNGYFKIKHHGPTAFFTVGY